MSNSLPVEIEMYAILKVSVRIRYKVAKMRYFYKPLETLISKRLPCSKTSISIPHHASKQYYNGNTYPKFQKPRFNRILKLLEPFCKHVSHISLTYQLCKIFNFWFYRFQKYHAITVRISTINDLAFPLTSTVTQLKYFKIIAFPMRVSPSYKMLPILVLFSYF